jgi:hypothetical protein
MLILRSLAWDVFARGRLRELSVVRRIRRARGGSLGRARLPGPADRQEQFLARGIRATARSGVHAAGDCRRRAACHAEPDVPSRCRTPKRISVRCSTHPRSCRRSSVGVANSSSITDGRTPRFLPSQAWRSSLPSPRDLARIGSTPSSDFSWFRGWVTARTVTIHNSSGNTARRPRAAIPSETSWRRSSAGSNRASRRSTPLLRQSAPR